MAVVSAVLAGAKQLFSPGKRGRAPITLRGLAGHIQARRRNVGLGREVERLRAELATERRARGLEQGQLRDAEHALTELRQIDRIGTVVAHLEAATAQLIVSIPTPTNRPPRKRPATGPEHRAEYTD